MESLPKACYADPVRMYSLETIWGQALADGRFAHAYLLVGEGAATVAREFLLRIYCERQCRTCAICLKILRGTHPDVKWVEKEGKRIGIDQIRQIQKDARYQPMESPRKVYILDGAEHLSQEAANSLLRILESPPEYVIFLLLARSLRLLPTILSRCQVLRLKPLSLSQMREMFQSRGLDAHEAEYLLALTHGFPERLSDLDLEQSGSSPLKRKSETLKRLQGITNPELIEFFSEAKGLIEEREAALELLKRLPEKQPHDILETAQILSKLRSEKLEFFLQEALRWYRDLALIRESDELIFNRDQQDELKQKRAGLDIAELTQAIDALEGAHDALQGNANVHLFLESLLFTLAGSGGGRSPG
ncbi:MAG: hypothetical protein A2Z21_01370 [Candidatus Fraserbacteria bacterium RBG_16_55_9]|uniref:DNA-directed DNA polymerase n=1 Tax=Fraserbacteria sp. (strain RBG_16_55_9) TaxID=1817864 RepID=A0A1F5UR90_FRAXR|nr:MAG: hypothetical protein A2Z21_01370 [Candidatus Fraserbacteria bacterium RBG_16_55_9]